MTNNQNKYPQYPQSSTPSYFDVSKKNPDLLYTPTPIMAQQTPQMMSQINYYNYASPVIQDFNSPNMYSKTNNLQIYNNITTTSPNFGNSQTPAMNLNSNNRNTINDSNTKVNSPLSPNILNSLAGSTPAQPNNITMYKSRNLNSDNKYSLYKNLPKELPINQDIQPKLQNIVSTANLGCQLKLRQIALQARNAEYNPKRFAAVIMRIKEPKTTALIFSSGKMVCTGAKSEEDSKKASRKYAKIIRSLGFPVEFKEFKVQNIVGSCDVKFQISLSKLNMKLGKLNMSSDNGSNKNKKYHIFITLFNQL